VNLAERASLRQRYWARDGRAAPGFAIVSVEAEIGSVAEFKGLPDGGRI